MNRTQPKTIDDLPELPFEQVLSYLSLGDLIKSKAVSRGWYQRIDSFRVKSIGCSPHPSRIIKAKRLVRGAYAQNFIGSPRLKEFFAAFSTTILANLKRLHLYSLDLDDANMAAYIQILNSLGHLEELHITGLSKRRGSDPIDVKLNLPMLRSIQLEDVAGVDRLTLDTPRLQAIKICDCSHDLRLALANSESVERLLTDQWQYLPVKNLKNLQHLHVKGTAQIDPTFLSSLEKLKEVHLQVPDDIRELFEQKRRCGRTDLKIYRFGLLLNGPDDPASAGIFDYNSAFVHLAQNPTRLADAFPLCRDLYYAEIEPVATQSAVNILKRFPDLQDILVEDPIQDTQRLLDLLKSLKSLDISPALWFYDDQPQDLYDRLPEHYAVRRLYIQLAPSDHQFLFRLRHLRDLMLEYAMDPEFVRKVFEELPLLCSFEFVYLNNEVRVKIGHSKQFEVFVYEEKKGKFPDLNAAIQFIVENVTEREISDSDDSLNEDFFLDEEDDENDEEEVE